MAAVIALIGVVTFAVIFGSVLLVARGLRAMGTTLSSRERILAGGVEAQGLVLSASRISSETSWSGLRYEQRDLVLDVEVPGQPPYEASVTPMIPRICEACPGAALDLRIDPADPNNIVIVGPAGSSAWLGAAPWLSPAPSTVAAGGKGCSIVAALVVAAGGAWLVVGIAVGVMATTTSTHSTPRHEAVVTKAQCEAATRCCKAVGTSDCRAFASMSEKACTAALEAERKVASKLGKRCP